MAIKVEDYGHSPAHYAVALRDHTRLSRLIAALPRLRDPIDILTESESLLEEKIAEQISSFLDRRDVSNRETPLHLAVRLNDVISARLLASAGADLTLQNAAGWSPLQEATCNGKTEMAGLLLRHHQRSAWAKWCRRLPRLLAVLRRMRDFYMEITFHFESSLLPFVSRIAPSDTYRIWKRDGNLRADMTLAGFDGLKIQRSDQTFLFLGEGSDGVSPGSLLVLSHEDKQIVNAFENAGAPPTPAEEAAFRSQTSVFRPGMDVTRAELVGRMNWRRQERMEMVGSWKARVYEVQNVLFSFKTRKVVEDEFLHVSPLELDEDPDGFLVAENPDVGFSRRRHSSFEKGDFYGNGVGNNSRRNSNFELGIKEDKEWISIGRKSFREDDEKRTIPNPITSSSSSSSSSCSSKRVFSVPARKSVDISVSEKRRISVDGRSSDGKKWAWRDSGGGGGGGRNVNKESEYMKNLRPSIWLTEQFPLKTEELLPLLDILANKVKAVRRLRELLTTKLPSGTFPVKVAIPVVPTVRVVITFTKFEELQPSEQFYTPLSSPRHLQGIAEETEQCTWGSWLKGNGGGSMNRSTGHCEAMPAKNSQQQEDPFAIPGDYSWTSIDAKRQRMKEKKSKSRKSK